MLEEVLARLEARLARVAPDLLRELQEARSLDSSAGATVTPELGSFAASLLESQWTGDAASPRARRDGDPGERYVDLGRIGAGGMGEVRRVHDRVFDRLVALKIVRADRPAARARFERESRITARLQHPCIPPVHDAGVWADGRPYFAMKLVEGRTLSEALRLAGSPVPAGGWTLHRLLEAFARICEAIAYAHERGVVHRDLKPDNLMLGAFGEVFVMDWGLAGSGDDPGDGVLDEPGGAGLTQAGQIFGTPAYMSPEQARGEAHGARPAADIYALGMILGEILIGRPLRVADDLVTALALAAGGVVDLPDRSESGATIPAELTALVRCATSADPSTRVASAAILAESVRAWLDGSTRRARARSLVDRAEALDAEVSGLQGEIARRTRDHRVAAAALPVLGPEERFWPLWAEADAIDGLEAEASRLEDEAEHLLHAALQRVPDLPDAHAALAERAGRAHRAAEAARSPRAAVLASRLARHLEALPQDHPTARLWGAYLAGTGSLSLRTDPPGANVQLFRYVRRHQALHEERLADLGPSPVARRELAMGSYLCLLEHPGRVPTQYPVLVGRQGAWDQPPVPLPELSARADGTCWVPPGPAIFGGDPVLRGGLASTAWVDGFFVQRHPVTWREYGRFLAARAAASGIEASEEHVPRRRGTTGARGDPVYPIRSDGAVEVPPHLLDTPVVWVDWSCVVAYAAWLRAASGWPWRPLTSPEWEKAARGADGRLFPWGDFLHATRAGCVQANPDATGPQVVGSFPYDRSPYGVEDMAGNVMEWTSTAEPPGSRLTRGGAWRYGGQNLRTAYALPEREDSRGDELGFRLGYGWPYAPPAGEPGP